MSEWGRRLRILSFFALSLIPFVFTRFLTRSPAAISRDRLPMLPLVFCLALVVADDQQRQADAILKSAEPTVEASRR